MIELMSRVGRATDTGSDLRSPHAEGGRDLAVTWRLTVALPRDHLLG